MKKQPFPLLVCLTVAFFCFLLGFLLGRNSRQGTLSIEALPVSPVSTTAAQTSEAPTEAPASTFPININTATAEELTALPGIGEELARRITDYRKSHNGFSSVEELLSIPGIGEKRFDAILNYITIGG